MLENSEVTNFCPNLLLTFTYFLILFLKKQHELFWTSFGFSRVAPGPDSCTLGPLLVSPVVLAKQTASPGLSWCANPEQDQPAPWRRSCCCISAFPPSASTPCLLLFLTLPVRVSIGQADLLLSCLLGFLPQMLYFWSGNPAPQRLVYASLPWGFFRALSFVPFFYRFLTGPLGCVVTSAGSTCARVTQITTIFFLAVSSFKVRGYSMCVCAWVVTAQITIWTAVISHSLYKGSFASSRPRYPWEETHPSTLAFLSRWPAHPRLS